MHIVLEGQFGKQFIPLSGSRLVRWDIQQEMYWFSYVQSVVQEKTEVFAEVRIGNAQNVMVPDRCCFKIISPQKAGAGCVSGSCE
jgi:hypothetical protein